MTSPPSLADRWAEKAREIINESPVEFFGVTFEERVKNRRLFEDRLGKELAQAAEEGRAAERAIAAGQIAGAYERGKLKGAEETRREVFDELAQMEKDSPGSVSFFTQLTDAMLKPTAKEKT